MTDKEGRGYLSVFQKSVTEGEHSDTVGIIQIILNALKVRYDGYDFFPVSFTHEGESVNAVKVFQHINALTETGTVDLETWNALAAEYGILKDTE